MRDVLFKKSPKDLDTGYYPPCVKESRGDLRASQLEKSPLTSLCQRGVQKYNNACSST
jgi:hypothetical protein